MFVLHVRSHYISLVNTSFYIFSRDYATRENNASGVHSVKYISILHWNKKISSLYIYYCIITFYLYLKFTFFLFLNFILIKVIKISLRQSWKSQQNLHYHHIPSNLVPSNTDINNLSILWKLFKSCFNPCLSTNNKIIINLWKS